jgi:hypothetical protein
LDENIRKQALKATLDLHRKWVQSGGKEGERLSLKGAMLIAADFEGSDLWEANFRKATMTGANLVEANLERANLWGAFLGSAILMAADLNKTDLRGAKITGALLPPPLYFPIYKIKTMSSIKPEYGREADVSGGVASGHPSPEGGHVELSLRQIFPR